MSAPPDRQEPNKEPEADPEPTPAESEWFPKPEGRDWFDLIAGLLAGFFGP
jgi:hypothetical protein